MLPSPAPLCDSGPRSELGKEAWACRAHTWGHCLTGGQEQQAWASTQRPSWGAAMEPFAAFLQEGRQREENRRPRDIPGRRLPEPTGHGQQPEASLWLPLQSEAGPHALPPGASPGTNHCPTKYLLRYRWGSAQGPKGSERLTSPTPKASWPLGWKSTPGLLLPSSRCPK